MSQSYSATGGARIGWTNATWPLAQLSATPEALTVSVLLLGTYAFTPGQVVSVERYTRIPVLGWGIQINHCRHDYPDHIVFWCFGSPDAILRGIGAAGFVPAARGAIAVSSRGFPLRWSAIIIAVVVWNALLLPDFLRSLGGPPQFGLPAIAALGFLFAVSIGALSSPRFQRLVLKPDRSVNEVCPFLRLLAFISGVMFVVLSIVVACGGFR